MKPQIQNQIDYYNYGLLKTVLINSFEPPLKLIHSAEPPFYWATKFATPACLASAPLASTVNDTLEILKIN